jgi:hypothetical protein
MPSSSTTTPEARPPGRPNHGDRRDAELPTLNFRLTQVESAIADQRERVGVLARPPAAASLVVADHRHQPPRGSRWARAGQDRVTTGKVLDHRARRPGAISRSARSRPRPSGAAISARRAPAARRRPGARGAHLQARAHAAVRARARRDAAQVSARRPTQEGAAALWAAQAATCRWTWQTMGASLEVTRHSTYRWTGAQRARHPARRPVALAERGWAAVSTLTGGLGRAARAPEPCAPGELAGVDPVDRLRDSGRPWSPSPAPAGARRAVRRPGRSRACGRSSRRRAGWARRACGTGCRDGT